MCSPGRREAKGKPCRFGWVGVGGVRPALDLLHGVGLVLTLFYAFADGASTIALLIIIAFGILATIVGIRIIRIHSTRGGAPAPRDRHG